LIFKHLSNENLSIQNKNFETFDNNNISNNGEYNNINNYLSINNFYNNNKNNDNINLNLSLKNISFNDTRLDNNSLCISNNNIDINILMEEDYFIKSIDFFREKMLQIKLERDNFINFVNTNTDNINNNKYVLNGKILLNKLFNYYIGCNNNNINENLFKNYLRIINEFNVLIENISKELD